MNHNALSTTTPFHPTYAVLNQERAMMCMSEEQFRSDFSVIPDGKGRVRIRNKASGFEKSCAIRPNGRFSAYGLNLDASSFPQQGRKTVR